MIKNIKTYSLFLLVIAGQLAFGQSDKEKALEKGNKAIELEDGGKMDEAIKLLEESQKLDPDNFNYWRCYN